MNTVVNDHDVPFLHLVVHLINLYRPSTPPSIPHHVYRVSRSFVLVDHVQFSSCMKRWDGRIHVFGAFMQYGNTICKNKTQIVTLYRSPVERFAPEESALIACFTGHRVVAKTRSNMLVLRRQTMTGENVVNACRRYLCETHSAACNWCSIAPPPQV